MIGAYLAFTGKRVGMRPEDRSDAEIHEGAGEQGHFSPWSWWPLVLGLACAAGFLGLAIGFWIVFIAGRPCGRRPGRLGLRVQPRRPRALASVGHLQSQRRRAPPCGGARRRSLFAVCVHRAETPWAVSVTGEPRPQGGAVVPGAQAGLYAAQRAGRLQQGRARPGPARRPQGCTVRDGIGATASSTSQPQWKSSVMTSSRDRASTPGLPSLLMVTGSPVSMDGADEQRRRPRMQSDGGLDDCVAYWQRGSLVSDGRCRR